MNNPVIADLVRRVERLERLLAEMRVGEEGGREEPVVDPREQPVQPIEPLSLGPSPLKAGARAVASGSARSERFLSRVGIGFVLLALAFLLKLSFDRGWITPMIRLVLGGTCGVALLAVGLRLESDRRRLAQAFLGGGVATFYLVAFAGFRLYGLIPFWPALLVMTATTFLSYALSDRQDVASLAVIGVSGGLATPFLLDAAAGDPGSLASYATVVLLGAGAVQLHRGWSSLLAMMTVGGASVVAAMASSPVSTAAVAVTGATFVYWLVVSVSPLLRIRYGRRPPEEERPGYSMGVWVARSGWVVGTGVAVGAVAEVWDMGRVSSGLLLLGIAGGAGLFAFASARHLLSRIVAGELAALTAAAGLLLSAGWSTGLLLVAVEAWALWTMVDRGAPRSLSVVAHGLVVLVALLYLPVAAEADSDGFLLRDGAWSRLAVLGIVAVATRRLRPDAAVLYRFLVHVGLMTWFLVEFEPFENGMALVSAAWAVQGAVVLFVSIQRDSRAMKLLGLGTLALVALKLLLLDLATVDAVWRIFLFLGFGIALLGLSYVVNRPESGVSPDEAPDPETLRG